jgi:hypothetical protein
MGPRKLLARAVAGDECEREILQRGAGLTRRGECSVRNDRKQSFVNRVTGSRKVRKVGRTRPLKFIARRNFRSTCGTFRAMV